MLLPESKANALTSIEIEILAALREVRSPGTGGKRLGVRAGMCGLAFDSGTRDRSVCREMRAESKEKKERIHGLTIRALNAE